MKSAPFNAGENWCGPLLIAGYVEAGTGPLPNTKYHPREWLDGSDPAWFRRGRQTMLDPNHPPTSVGGIRKQKLQLPLVG